MFNSRSREWMYNRIYPRINNISKEYSAGVDQFIEFASSQLPVAKRGKGKFPCPCIICQNEKSLKADIVSTHLHGRGFMPHYYVWYEHGEYYDVTGAGTSSHYDTRDCASGSQSVEHDIGNVYAGMVNDAFQGSTAFNATHHGHEYGNVDGSGYYVQEEPTHEAKKFYDMLDVANTPVYEGCRPGQSKLSLAARFMNLKVDNNMSESPVDGWAELFREYLPKSNQATGSYYET